MRPKLWLRCLTTAVLFSMLVSPAYAYIDPTASSLLTQFLGPLAAVALAGWALAKEKIAKLFHAITALFRRAR